jgi:glycerophosphoryl diester phosphodiesterase
MSIETKNKLELDYSEIVTLRVIEKNEDLYNIFTDEVNISFNLLKSLIKEDGLSIETKKTLKDIFEQVILNNKKLIKTYLELSKPTDPNEIPRRYGKEKILKDINKQGGNPTLVQRAMLRVNDLKNIYAVLSSRGIKDMVTGTNTLSDVDCRDIISAITIIERRLDNLLKKKK